MFDKSKTTGRSVAFAVSSIVALAFGFALISPENTKSLLHHTGYWFVAVATALFAYHLIRIVRDGWPRIASDRLQIGAILVAAVLAAFATTRQERGFRVVMDEPNLATTAIAMHTDRTTSMVEPSYGVSNPMPSLDKRPFFYPFLVSVAHDLLGFNPENPFRVNYLCTAILFYLVFQISLRISGSSIAAAAGTLFLAIHPLTVHYSASAGFEILNLLMIALTGYLSIRYFEEPTERTLSALLLSAALLAQTRYESVIYVLAVGAVVVVRQVKSRALSVSWTAVAVPLLLLPTAWQNTYIRANPFFWDMPNDTYPVFGFANLGKNLNGARSFFLAPESIWPSSAALSVVGLVALAGLLFALVGRPKQVVSFCGKAFWPIVAFGAASALSVALLMLYFWGDIRELAASRLALPFVLITSIVLSGMVGALASRIRNAPILALGSVLVCLVWIHPTLAERNYTYSTSPFRRFEWTQNSIHELGTERILVIDGFAKMWSSFGVNAIPLTRAVYATERLAFHHKQKTYDTIYVVQSLHQDREIVENGFVLNKGNDLGPAFKLEEIDTHSFIPYNLIRLSRLVSIDLTEIEKVGGPGEYFLKYGAKKHVGFERLSVERMKDWEKSLP